jgi:NADH-quinone oxidoreductase subunit J
MNLELGVFLVISAITVISSTLVLTSKEIFRSALSLALMLLGVAAIFIMLGAEFLAAIQILVYAGAIVILILFAIMLTQREEREVS